MKLRYLFSMILASALMFVSCVDEMGTDSFDNIKLDKTILIIPEAGGTVELKVNATEAWAFDTLYTEDVWPNVIKRDKNKETGEVTVKSVTPSWLTVDTMVGEVGETVVKFTADEVAGGRELELCIKAGANSQFVKIRQGSLTITKATVAEIIAGPEGKLYEVSGVCTAIANTTYGNWYLQDSSTEDQLYIYGTINEEGKYDWDEFGIEIGDVVTVQGSYVLYNGTTPEFVDASFIKVEKSLVKVLTEPQTVAKEGEEIEVEVAYKGEGVFPTIPEEYRSWVSVVDIQTREGEPTKIEPNPADTATVTISVFANAGGPRSAEVEFVSGTSSVKYAFEQDGTLLEIADGYYWLIANNAGANVAASPVPADKKYGYLAVAEATATTAPGASAFYFAAIEGGYTIQDLSGRYYYQKGTYDNFNVSTELPESGHIWSLIANDDGTVKILNTEVKKFIQFDAGYNSWGSYSTAKGVLPALVSAVAPVIADGSYYIEVSAGVATPIDASKTYGYVNVAEKVAANLFTFKFTEGKGYTICDASGRYYYQKGTYNSFNLDANPSEGQYWSILPQADGTVKILNRSVNKWWQYSTGYKSFGSYDSPQDGGELPKLVEGAPAADPWETAATFTNGADATDDTRLKELKAYADADYLYVRLTATKEAPFGADFLDFHLTDGEGDNEVRWMWTTHGTDIYYQEHKCELNENGELTKMRWYPVEGDRVYIDDYTTTITDTEVRWEMKFPRSYVDVYKSSTGKTFLSFILWNGWNSYWVIPARGNAMLEVTLP